MSSCLIDHSIEDFVKLHHKHLAIKVLRMSWAKRMSIIKLPNNFYSSHTTTPAERQTTIAQLSYTILEHGDTLHDVEYCTISYTISTLYTCFLN